jgi:thiamine-phosphate pyrophosphorylase
MRSVAPKLIAITDLERATEQISLERFELWARAAQPGSLMIQLRDRKLSDRRRLAFGMRLRELTRAYNQLFAVNDRIDLALLLGADGLHLGEGSVEPARARTLVDPLWISRACHDPADALVPGADAILLSPLLAARKERPALGLEALGRARAQIAQTTGARVSVYALGGVDAGNAAACLTAGADGIAAIGALLDSADPAPLLRALGVLS